MLGRNAAQVPRQPRNIYLAHQLKRIAPDGKGVPTIGRVKEWLLLVVGIKNRELALIIKQLAGPPIAIG
jgi:hypothetical protein